MNDSKRGYVYILFSKRNGTLYTGFSTDLVKRVHQHKTKAADGFTSRYGIDKLGYYEVIDSIEEAIVREKQVKDYKRKIKLRMINGMNPEWKDLYEDLV